MAVHRVPRRANLATIVGSSLAVVAAASLIVFSSLAEQAGLDGLATGRLEPTRPGRTDGAAHAITVPAPATAPPGDPREEFAERVRAAAEREPERALMAFETANRAPAPRPEKTAPKRAPRVEETARVAVTEPEVDEGTEAAEPDGPPYGHAYGHAYGHYKKKHKAPKPGKKHAPKSRSAEEPVYARSTNEDGGSKPAKAPKMQKVEKVKPAGHPGKGKAKGHSKHAHKGKGKGHSKHGD